jgi:hypothetical protein
MTAPRKWAIHATRTYFVTAVDEDEALDLFYSGSYDDTSDEDTEVEPWDD